jgi:signal transduction histidine kinase
MPETRRFRIRLWHKFALVAVLTVVLTHVVHLAVAQRVGTRALERQQIALGQQIARLVAENVTEPMLVGAVVDVNEIVSGAAAADELEYCLVHDGSGVVASSLLDTPDALVRARPAGNPSAMRVTFEGRQVLDVTAPILAGKLGTVRIGLSLEPLAAANEEIDRRLGILAAAIIVAGAGVSFVLARNVARPISKLLAAFESFDPAKPGPAPEVKPRGTDEIAVLTSRFNKMMRRLQVAHADADRAREQSFAAERLAAIGALIAGVAHEVNNPLAALTNCVRRFEKPNLPEPKRAIYLAHMRNSVQRIASVIQRLLDFSRPAAASVAIVRTGQLAREAIDLVEPLLGDRHVRCTLEEDEGDAPVVVDRHQLGQALLNLLANAAYVTPKEGTIRVALRTRGNLHGIAVADDGPGIPPELRDRVLDPFFTTKPVGEGTGLGLAVTRSIIEAHGGELTFEFPEYGGTVATIWLRRALADAEAHAAAG